MNRPFLYFKSRHSFSWEEKLHTLLCGSLYTACLLVWLHANMSRHFQTCVQGPLFFYTHTHTRQSVYGMFTLHCTLSQSQCYICIFYWINFKNQRACDTLKYERKNRGRERFAVLIKETQPTLHTSMTILVLVERFNLGEKSNKYETSNSHWR